MEANRVPPARGCGGAASLRSQRAPQRDARGKIGTGVRIRKDVIRVRMHVWNELGLLDGHPIEQLANLELTEGATVGGGVPWADLEDASGLEHEADDAVIEGANPPRPPDGHGDDLIVVHAVDQIADFERRDGPITSGRSDRSVRRSADARAVASDVSARHRPAGQAAAAAWIAVEAVARGVAGTARGRRNACGGRVHSARASRNRDAELAGAAGRVATGDARPTVGTRAAIDARSAIDAWTAVDAWTAIDAGATVGAGASIAGSPVVATARHQEDNRWEG